VIVQVVVLLWKNGTPFAVLPNEAAAERFLEYVTTRPGPPTITRDMLVSWTMPVTAGDGSRFLRTGEWRP
jgi:hypothetical protein